MSEFFDCLFHSMLIIALNLPNQGAIIRCGSNEIMALTGLAAELPATANVHLAATEHEGRIVFLHSVEDGPASQSYGIQVARLAGVPDAVLDNARARLQALEQSQAARPPLQPDLFGAPEDPAPTPAAVGADPAAAGIAAALKETDLDALTPRAALELLYGLKERLDPR